MNKKELREKYKEIRKDNIPSDDIFNTIISLPEYINSKSIAIYYSTPYEVDTTKLIEYSLKQNKNVYLPRVVDKHRMVFIKIYNLQEGFTKSKYGILEPVYKEEDLLKDSIDWIIVPGLVFDKQKYRIGYGGGFYDTFLSTHEVYKIGVCFDNQIIDTIPREEHDIPMDIVATEKRLIK